MNQPFCWDDYPRHKVSPPDPASLRHEGLVRHLEELQSRQPGAMDVLEIGQSVEGRSISLVTLGTGRSKVLLWSQMHGDEPTHTAVLLDLLQFFQVSPDHPGAQAILQGCTLCMIPMLNPDGVERWTRQNAMDIDINRDALELATPEARVLDSTVDKLQPQFAFNLHNHKPHILVKDSGKRVALSLLVPPVDLEDSTTEGTLRAMHVASCFASAVADRAPGMIARYDVDFMPNAFGECIQQRGVSTVLVEAGGWEDGDLSQLVPLHYHGLLMTLHAIATGEYEEVSRAIYENLPPTIPTT